MFRSSRARHSDLAAKHRANIAASLTRRLEAARVANDQKLIEMLERERQQLAPDMDS